ncbi:hypothetical protein [Nostoc sp.]
MGSHIDIARGNNVDFAGQIRFGHNKNNKGQIKYWNNVSGNKNHQLIPQVTQVWH